MSTPYEAQHEVQNERDELAQIIREQPTYPAGKLADVLIAAGYRKVSEVEKDIEAANSRVAFLLRLATVSEKIMASAEAQAWDDGFGKGLAWNAREGHPDGSKPDFPNPYRSSQ